MALTMLKAYTSLTVLRAWLSQCGKHIHLSHAEGIYIFYSAEGMALTVLKAYTSLTVLKAWLSQC